VLVAASSALAAVRKARTSAHRSLRAPVSKVTITDGPERVAALRSAEDDLREAGNVTDLVLREGEPSIEVALAEG
jgi:valyl-tRNA synthetase